MLNEHPGVFLQGRVGLLEEVSRMFLVVIKFSLEIPFQDLDAR